MPPRTVGRRSAYRVPLGRDIAGAVRDLPRHLVSMFRTGRAMVESQRDERPGS